MRNWSEDPYWVEPLDRYVARSRRRHKIVINLKALERVIFNGDGPAYRLMEAMSDLKADEVEAYSGYRGAPRILKALLQILSELPNEPEQDESDRP